MEWVLLGIVGLLILYVIIEYNKLVRYRNIFQNAFKQIDVTLKQRHDMIPQLVSTVKGYAKHEQETLNGVIEARNQAEKCVIKLTRAMQSQCWLLDRPKGCWVKQWAVSLRYQKPIRI